MKLKSVKITAVLLAGLVLGGCSAGVDDEMLAYIDEVKARPGGRIEPLPQVKPYETYRYAVDADRSPFQPDEAKSASIRGMSPQQNRSKEYLEQFPLDTMTMVGTLDSNGKTFGLVRTQDGMVHRVMAGNYLGQNDGRVTVIGEAGISVEELAPDGLGGYYNRTAQVGLKD